MKRKHLTAEAIARLDSDAKALPSLPTGPRSDVGKAVSRYNATQHGLSSRQVVIEKFGETDEEWDSHLAAVIDDLDARTYVERKVASQIAFQLWHQERRILRYRTMTARQHCDQAEERAFAIFEQTGRIVNPDTITERATLGETRELAKADRAEAHCLNALDRLFRRYYHLVSNRTSGVRMIVVVTVNADGEVQNEPRHYVVSDDTGHNITSRPDPRLKKFPKGP